MQQFRKRVERQMLAFKDALAKDKAKELISNCSQQNIFQSVSVQQKSYPVIVRLNGLSQIQSLTVESNKQEERQMRCAAIMKVLVDENPSLQNDLTSARILSNRQRTCSFHVRLGISSKNVWGQLLERGRVVIDNRAHAVVAADPEKKSSKALGVRKFGHLAFFCKAMSTTKILNSFPTAFFSTRRAG